MRAVLAALLLSLAGTARGAAFRAGTGGAAAQFLRLGPGARALSMGEAYGPVAEGPEAIYWNPAGLAKLQKPELAYTHVEMLRFFHHDHVAYAHPVRALGGTVAAAATVFYQDSLDLVTNTNQTVGRFSSHSEAYSIAYARAFGLGEDHRTRDRAFFQDAWNLPGVYRPLLRESEPWNGNLMAGLALKTVMETIHDKRASAFAADGGVLFRHYDLSELSLSFTFRNVGNRLRFIRAYESLPAEVSAGAAYDFPLQEHRLLAAFEVSVPYHGDPYAKVGAEYSARLAEATFASVRFGYKTLSAAALGPLTGLTGGVGLRHGRFSADVGFQPMADLGESYRMSLGYRF